MLRHLFPVDNSLTAQALQASLDFQAVAQFLSRSPAQEAACSRHGGLETVSRVRLPETVSQVELVARLFDLARHVFVAFNKRKLEESSHRIFH